jgi:molybdenum cofactor synthesis domain-containing protein
MAIMRVAILTISDSVAAGRMGDGSGPALRRECEARGWLITAMEMLPDDEAAIGSRIASICDGCETDVIFTTGGTGLGPRDVTPEATLAVAKRLVPGLAELMRAECCRKNPRAALSRGVVAQRGQNLIVNLPGSPAGAVESFCAVAELLPHAVEVIRGARHEIAGAYSSDESERS